MTNGTNEQFNIIYKILVIYMTAFKVPSPAAREKNQGQVLIAEVAEPQKRLNLQALVGKFSNAKIRVQTGSKCNT